MRIKDATGDNWQKKWHWGMYIITKYKKHLEKHEHIRRRVFFKCTRKASLSKKGKRRDGTNAAANITLS